MSTDMGQADRTLRVQAKPIPNKKYRITINNSGEIITLYTHALSTGWALSNAASQLAARLHITRAAAMQRMKKPNATKLEMINGN